MLAGSPPFDGESAQSILMKQATATPVPIRQLRSDVPPALAAVIERLLAKDPAERFQTAEQVSRALVEALPAAAGERVRVRGSAVAIRSEEHTSELQSRLHLVCRLLLEKKKKDTS